MRTLTISACIVIAVIVTISMQDNETNKAVEKVSEQCMQDEKFMTAYKEYARLGNDRSSLHYLDMVKHCEPLQTYENQRRESAKKIAKEIDGLHETVVESETTKGIISLLMVIALMIAIAKWGLSDLIVSKIRSRRTKNVEDK